MGAATFSAVGKINVGSTTYQVMPLATTETSGSGTSASPYTIQPNQFCGLNASLSGTAYVSLAGYNSNVNVALQEYMFSFQCVDSALSLVVTPSVKWAGPTNFTANYKYEVSVIKGVAVCHRC